ncbi:hypothetical protein [Haloarcula montana]|uniref:hypothetical protein n=1 Tax=Haloarcula montana TaxID=3111776 RepID=UPI002D76C2D1|nr:hypothetical protein [Haloarcula sp. GH36]
MTTIQRSADDPIETVAELLDVIERRPSLAVEADLTVTVDDTTVSVTGYDDVVAADVDSFGPVVALWRRYGDRTMDGAAALASVGLTAELRVRGVPVARLGSEADPSPLARHLGLGPVELVPEGPLLAAITRRRG